MTKRQTVAVKVGDEVRLFNAAEALCWQDCAEWGDTLYRVAGRWVLRTTLDALGGQPARIVTDDEALQWLAINGRAIPPELAELAEKMRLR